MISIKTSECITRIMPPPRAGTEFHADDDALVIRSPSLDEYWIDQPEELSLRCLWWLKRIQAGWRPNRRIRSMGYSEAVEFFGVWYWEYLHILSPRLGWVCD